MFHKKLLWALKRHPFLYKTRFKLLSKNSGVNGIGNLAYNNSNPIEEIPELFYSLNKEIFGDTITNDEFEFTKVLCAWLHKNIKGGPGLSMASEEAMMEMIRGNGGVCSDKTQVFNNFCVINKVKVREWGSTRIPFDNSHGGHSFNEIYSSKLNNWILIDSSLGIYFTDSLNNPQSVLDFFENVREGEKLQAVPLNEGREINHNEINNIYFHKDVCPFLIVNYSNRVYDRYLKTLHGKLPVFLIHFLIFLRGKSYNYQFPIDNYKDIFK